MTLILTVGAGWVTCYEFGLDNYGQQLLRRKLASLGQRSCSSVDAADQAADGVVHHVDLTDSILPPVPLEVHKALCAHLQLEAQRLVQGSSAANAQDLLFFERDDFVSPCRTL